MTFLPYTSVFLLCNTSLLLLWNEGDFFLLFHPVFDFWGYCIVAFSFYAYIYIYVYMLALSFSGTVIWAMWKKRNQAHEWVFSCSYWRAAQCDSTASCPAAVWAGKHKKYEPKCPNMASNGFWCQSTLATGMWMKGKQLWTMFCAQMYPKSDTLKCKN